MPRLNRFIESTPSSRVYKRAHARREKSRVSRSEKSRQSSVLRHTAMAYGVRGFVLSFVLCRQLILWSFQNRERECT